MTFNYAFSSSIISFEKGVEFYDMRSSGAVGLKANPVYIDSAISSFSTAKNIKPYERRDKRTKIQTSRVANCFRFLAVD